MPLATGAAHGVPIQLSPTEASSGYLLRPVVDAVGGGQNNASYLGFLLHSPYVGERVLRRRYPNGRGRSYRVRRQLDERSP